MGRIRERAIKQLQSGRVAPSAGASLGKKRVSEDRKKIGAYVSKESAAAPVDREQLLALCNKEWAQHR